jgi:hypothetical protein
MDIMLWVKRKASENIHGPMVLFMKVNGLIIELTVKGFTFGKMAENIMENGKIMIWKAMVFIIGVMAVDMKGNIITIRNADMVFITGQMAEDMKVGGTKGNNMVLDVT